MQFSRTKQLCIGSLLLVVVFAGVYYSVFAQVRSKNEEVSKLAQEIDILLAQQQRSETLGELLTNTQAQRQALAEYFVESEELVSFLEEIEQMGKRINVTVSTKSVDVVQSDPESFYETIQVRLLASGTWANVFHYFSLLESLPYRITMERVDFQKVTAETTENWESAVVFTMYKFK